MKKENKERHYRKYKIGVIKDIMANWVNYQGHVFINSKHKRASLNVEFVKNTTRYFPEESRIISHVFGTSNTKEYGTQVYKVEVWVSDNEPWCSKPTIFWDCQCRFSDYNKLSACHHVIALIRRFTGRV